MLDGRSRSTKKSDAIFLFAILGLIAAKGFTYAGQSSLSVNNRYLSAGYLDFANVRSVLDLCISAILYCRLFVIAYRAINGAPLNLNPVFFLYLTFFLCNLMATGTIGAGVFNNLVLSFTFAILISNIHDFHLYIFKALVFYGTVNFFIIIATMFLPQMRFFFYSADSRFFGITGQPNHLAFLSLVLLVFVLHFPMNNSLRRYWLLFMTITLLITSASRWALILAAIFFLLKNTKTKRVKLLIGFFLCLQVVVLFFPMYFSELSPGRFEIWQSTISRMDRFSIFGVGANFWTDREIWTTVTFAFHAHNNFLDVYLLFGVIGMIAFIVMSITIIQSQNSNLPLWTFAAFVAYGVTEVPINVAGGLDLRSGMVLLLCILTSKSTLPIQFSSRKETSRKSF
jgi:hypothetical protein